MVRSGTELTCKKRKGKKEVEDVMGKAIKGTVTKKGKKVKIYTKSKGDVGKRRNVTKTVVNEKTGKVKEKKITGARASRQVERAEKKGRKTKGPIIATDE